MADDPKKKTFTSSVGTQSGSAKAIRKRARKSGRGEKVKGKGEENLAAKKTQTGTTTHYSLTRRLKSKPGLVGTEFKQTTKGSGSKSTLEPPSPTRVTTKTYTPYEERIANYAKSYGREKPGQSMKESPEVVQQARRDKKDVVRNAKGKLLRAGFTDRQTTSSNFTPKIKVTAPTYTKKFELKGKTADGKTPERKKAPKLLNYKKRAGCSPNARGLCKH